jgi:transposase-like protein
LQLSRIYEVSSTAFYKWIRKYLRYSGQQERVVLQKESEQAKTMSLIKKVADFEQLIGQKQVEAATLPTDWN